MSVRLVGKAVNIAKNKYCFAVFFNAALSLRSLNSCLFLKEMPYSMEVNDRSHLSPADFKSRMRLSHL